MEFLGYIISPEGISMDQRKVVAIQEWQPPTQVRDVQSFLGFANFYHQFIKGFSKMQYMFLAQQYILPNILNVQMAIDYTKEFKQ